jgi:hypothetical protein
MVLTERRSSYSADCKPHHVSNVRASVLRSLDQPLTNTCREDGSTGHPQRMPRHRAPKRHKRIATCKAQGSPLPGCCCRCCCCRCYAAVLCWLWLARSSSRMPARPLSLSHEHRCGQHTRPPAADLLAQTLSLPPLQAALLLSAAPRDPHSLRIRRTMCRPLAAAAGAVLMRRADSCGPD